MNRRVHNQILIGDALDQLRRLPEASVDCIITSPPYYMLRNYGVEGQLGMEANVDEWVDNLRRVGSELARIIKPTGSLWLNLGDSFSRHEKYGAPPKGLLAAPERLLLALMDDGWICRGKAIWSKPNPMPSSVTDRLNMTYEVCYHLVRSRRYYFNLHAIREPHRSKALRSARSPITEAPAWAGPLAGKQDGLRRGRPDGIPGHPLGKNPGDIWIIPTQGFRGAHFATFPEALVVKPLLATCPERICIRCGQPWHQRVTSKRVLVSGRSKIEPIDPNVFRFKSRWQTVHHLGSLIPCACAAPSETGLVLDPFFGSGTVGVVAESYGRNWLGIELNPEYANLAQARIRDATAVRQERRTKERDAA